MRLWSLAPELLDAKGLVALWREALLAKHVLEGKTKGYTHHPQLLRFRNTAEPLCAINSYLYFVYQEALSRGYNFDSTKFSADVILTSYIPLTKGQVIYEFEHLLRKLVVRDPSWYTKVNQIIQTSEFEVPGIHPLFYLVTGTIEPWEKTT